MFPLESPCGRFRETSSVSPFSLKADPNYNELQVIQRERPKLSKNMVNVELMFDVSFTLALLLLCIQPTIAAPPLNSNCTERCGNLNITYPFGMGQKECYLNEWFEIECNKSVYPHRPFLRRTKMEVLDISVGGSATVISPIMSSNCSGWEGDEPINLTGSPFCISNSNSFISVGCNTRALLMDEPLLRVGCDSRCHNQKAMDLREMLPQLITTDSDGYNYIGSACNGTGCCKITVPSTVQVFNPILNQHTGGCELAFLAVDGGQLYRPEVSKFPMMLYWTINSTQTKAIDRETANCSSYPYGNSPEFQCYCNDGYEGNPYIGCTDTDECKIPNYHLCRRFTKCMNTKGSYKCVPDPKWIIIIVLCGVIGVLAIPLGCWRLYKLLRKLRDIQLKKKFFKRNGGLLLKQQLNSSDGSVQKTKIFSSKELEKATDRFSENRILGQGGQGTVYKGMLTDGRIVAIKKSKLLDEEKLQEFINEVVILSQVNHRNVVRLLGCSWRLKFLC